VSDTLGWILYQRGVYERAWTLLRDSATKLPDNPEVQYHAGMAARQLGQSETARTYLQRAVAFAGDFPAKRDARKALGELQ
jgi:Flp pilus assembly protein TadD